MLLRQLFEELSRTGKGDTAVVGWGRGMGHKGHMMLASSVITKAKEVSGDPYFVVSRTVGKDDPITPEEKLAIYKKVFPQQGHIFQAASDEIPDLTRVLTNLNRQGYKNAVVVVGADQVKAFQYLKQYNGKADKSGNIAFQFDSLEVISRQETGDPSAGEEGPRATPMRNILNDPNATPEQQFQVWRDAMSPEVSDDEVRDLMTKAKERMAQFSAPKKKIKENTSAKNIAALNNIKDVNKIQVGQQLKLPDGTMYTVSKGDTLSNIAAGKFNGPISSAPAVPARTPAPATPKPPAPAPAPVSTSSPQEPGVWDKFKSALGFGKKEEPAEPTNKEPKIPTNAVRSADGTPVKTGSGGNVVSGTPAPDPKAVAAAKAKLTPSQLKWLGKADPTDPAIMARMPKPLPGEKAGAEQTGSVTSSAPDKPIASIVNSGPGFIEVKTVDGEIQRREGTANWRMNNPGNIRVSGWTKSQPGFVGAGDAGPSGKFAVFATLDDGIAAKKSLLFGPKSSYINLSIADAISKYAPPNENNTEAYIATIVKATNASPNTLLNQLSPAQREAMFAAINKAEGFKVGKIKTIEPTNIAEKMLPKSAFAGSDKNKLGSAAHAKGKQKSPVKKGQFVGGMEEEKQRLDPKCWKGYRKSGTKMKGSVRVNNCVPVSEDVERIMSSLIEDIIKK